MKTAISIPDSLFAAAEALAGRLGISRSVLYQRAVAQYLSDHGNDMVRDKLDEVYGEDASRDQGALDPSIEYLQRLSLDSDEWS